MGKRLLSLVAAALLAFCLSSYAQAAGGMTVTIQSPYSGAPSDTLLQIEAAVASDYELKSVVAKVGGKESILGLVCPGVSDCKWQGELSLEGLQKGPQILVVEAVDQLNHKAQASRSFLYDAPPVVTMSPAGETTVTTGQLHIAVSATDDLSVPEFEITLYDSYHLIGSYKGVGPVDKTFDVSGYAGKVLEYRLTVYDGNHVSRYEKNLHVYVENSDRLIKVGQASDTITDFDDSRILFVKDAHDVYMTNRLTGEETFIFHSAFKEDITGARLTPSGAVITHMDAGQISENRLLIWKDGELRDTGLHYFEVCCRVDGSHPIQVQGDFVLRNGQYQTLLLNTRTGEGQDLYPQGIRSGVLAPGGEVTYTAQGYDHSSVYRYTAGKSTEKLMEDPIYDIRDQQWDGHTLAYLRNDKQLFRQDNGVASQVTDFVDGKYSLNNGWIAFERSSDNGSRQIYMQSPEGTVTQATYYFTNGPLIDKVGSDGSLAFQHKQTLYIQPAGSQDSVELGTAYGFTRFHNGKWYKVVGNAIFQVNLGAADHTPPVWPSTEALTANSITDRSVSLQWQPATDDTGVARYHIFINGALSDTVSGSVYSYTAKDLLPETVYAFEIEAEDGSGNKSESKPGLTIKTLATAAGAKTAIVLQQTGASVAEIGSIVDVQVRAEQAEDVYAFLLNMQYDATRLKLNQVLMNSEFGVDAVSAVLGKSAAVSGQVRVTGAELGQVPGKTGSIGLVTLRFQTLQNGASGISLRPGSSLSDSHGQIKQAEPVSIEVIVGGGDFDGDGIVGLHDLFLISQKNGVKRGQAGFEEQYDLRPDGVIDSRDIQYVANKAAKEALSS